MITYFYTFLAKEEYNFSNEWKQHVFVMANYVYLDTDEQEMFSKNSQEYLITQVQRREYSGFKSWSK